MKHDRRPGNGRPCLTPVLQNPRAITIARVEAGLSQQQLAKDVDISASYLSEVERGTRSLRAQNLRKVADRLGRTVADLMNPELRDVA